MVYSLLYQLHGCNAHMLAQHFTCNNCPIWKCVHSFTVFFTTGSTTMGVPDAQSGWDEEHLDHWVSASVISMYGNHEVPAETVMSALPAGRQCGFSSYDQWGQFLICWPTGWEVHIEPHWPVLGLPVSPCSLELYTCSNLFGCFSHFTSFQINFKSPESVG